ncbi:MAG: UPF0183 family protein [Desulfobacterales bacterium]|nr:UPF0183 family protein [Desulfobacterales bacterium]
MQNRNIFKKLKIFKIYSYILNSSYRNVLYFQDVLFDAETQRVKKFVLHTNYPGHFDFSM